MNILVTGAKGQLAQEIKNVVEASTKNDGNNYFYFDRNGLDIGNEEEVIKCITNLNINVIVNCAAYTAVDKAENPEEMANAFLANAYGAKNLATAAKKNDAVLIHISTDYVFDGKQNVPYKPDDFKNPQNVYGSSKQAGEIMIEDSGCKYIILRTSWLYSSFGNNFVKKMYNLMHDKPSVKVVMDQVGSPTYAWDLACFICYIIKNSEYLAKTGIYHFANLGVASWYDLTHEINAYCPDLGLCEVLPCASDEYPTPVKRPHYSVLDTSSLRETFNWGMHHWVSSLHHCLDIIMSE